MLHNILGRSKSGKTEYLYSVCEKLIEEKRHTFLIVPEQSAVLTERSIIERFGNRSNQYIEVINFKRLCNRVFRETGGLTQSYVDNAHKLLVMSKALEMSKDMLLKYKGACENADFAKKALEAVNEFENYNVTAKLLEKCTASVGEKDKHLAGKLSDLSLIYASYLHLISEYGYHDSYDDLVRLSRVLHDTKFFKDKTVIIDSFYGFTVPELDIISTMVQDAKDIYISYLADSESDILFGRGSKAYNRICSFANTHGTPIKDIHTSFDSGYKNSGLFTLEKNFAFELFSSKKRVDEAQKDNSVRILECESIYEEAQMAAAIVRYLTTHKNAKFSDIAICARNIGDYFGILDSELLKNGIAFNFNIKYDLLTRPVIAYILSAFEFARSKSKQSALRLLKTGLTLLSEHEADLTECYIKTWNIQGRMFTDTEWLMNPDGYKDASEMDERTKTALEIIENARVKLVTPLMAFEEDIRNADCTNDISRAVLKLLSESSYNSEHLSEDEIRYHNMVMDALDCMADVMGEEKITPKKYAALFEMIISQYDTGKIPSTIDEVSISDAELFRSGKTEYMIVLGVNEGIFPRTPSDNDIFSDKEKEMLKESGLELSENSVDKVYDELFLAYKVISAPSSGLYMLYSSKTPKGDDQPASSIISMCESAIGTAVKESGDKALDLLLCLCDSSLSSLAVRTQIPELEAALRDYLASKGIKVKELSYNSQENLTDDTVKDVFGENLVLSPSRLDKFNYCACSYFATYTLGLRPEPVATLGSIESGNIIHKILELLLSELSEKKQNGEEITVEYALTREKEILENYIFELVGGEKAKGSLTGRFKYLYGRLSGALESCVTVMTRELLQSDFVPADFEMSIGGKNADVPFTAIPILDENGSSHGTLTINGKIDRTDVYVKNGKAYIKIIDYKTGNKKLNLSDVALGLNLQMLLYLYSLTKNCSERYEGSEVLPAGVLYTPIHRPSLKSELGENIEIDEGAAFKPNGILIDDKDVLCAMEKNLEGKYIPVRLKKDGSFYANSSITSLETMGRLLSGAADVAAKLALEIKKGKISKNPCKCDTVNSCAFCDMLPFCRYETGDTGTRYEMTKYIEETFEKTAGGDGSGI